MKNFVSQTVTFGRSGNSGDATIAGWYLPEDEHTWSKERYCSVWLDAPKAQFGYFIEVDWQPFLAPPFITQQVVRVEINAHIINSFSIDRGGLFAFYCPPLPADHTRLVVGFHFTNAARPNDFGPSSDSRSLALCFRRLRVIVLSEPWRITPGQIVRSRITATEIRGIKDQAEEMAGAPLDAILHGFEMLCGNCDLGLALRAMDFETLSLLRFGGATVTSAIKGLESDFSGIGCQISLSIADNPIKEWMVRDDYGLMFHSGQSSESVDRSEMEKKFPVYVEFLRRKFIEDVDAGCKVFVFADHKDFAKRSIENVLPLYLALGRRSSASMLWVVAASHDSESKGSVRQILPGLAVAQLDLVAPPLLVGGSITVSGWLSVLCNAWRVFGLKPDTGKL